MQRRTESSIQGRSGSPARERMRSGSRLVSPELKNRSSKYYTIGEAGLSITCHLCGFASRDPRDVREKYCSRCRVFHEDRLLILRLTEGYRLLLSSEEECGLRLKAA